MTKPDTVRRADIVSFFDIIDAFKGAEKRDNTTAELTIDDALKIDGLTDEERKALGDVKENISTNRGKGRYPHDFLDNLSLQGITDLGQVFQQAANGLFKATQHHQQKASEYDKKKDTLAARVAGNHIKIAEDLNHLGGIFQEVASTCSAYVLQEQASTIGSTLAKKGISNSQTM